MGIKDKYYIKETTYQETMKIVIENHYLHRKAPCSHSFGLFEKETDKLIGVAVYGKPASHALCKGICGAEESRNVLELTRLWIEDSTPRNAESFLIGRTMNLVDAEILVSYAERDRGHIGYIYQATNWIYTGLSDKHIQWTVEGYSKAHSRHLFDKYGGVKKAKEALGDKMTKGERPRKHRYIFFNTNKRRKKELMNKLRYPIKDYPKG